MFINLLSSLCVIYHKSLGHSLDLSKLKQITAHAINGLFCDK